MTKADLPKHWKFISAITAIIAVSVCISSFLIGGLYMPLPQPGPAGYKYDGLAANGHRQTYRAPVVYLNRLTGTVWVCISDPVPLRQECVVWG